MPTSPSPPKSFFPLPEAPRMPRRRPHALAKVVSTLGVLGVLLLVAAVVAIWRFDINSYKPQIEAAVRAATGRNFVIRGKLTVLSYFSPTIAANDVVLDNPPGVTPREMVKVARIEADLGMRALWAGRVEIARLVAIAPDVLLEIGRDGKTNWAFPHSRAAPAAPAAPGPTTPGPATLAAVAPPVAVRTMHIKDARVVWRDLRSGAQTSFGIKRLSAIESTDVSQIQWVADLQFDTGRVLVTGQTGALVRLLDPTASTPWNVYFRANPQGALLTVAGSMRHPLEASGYDLQLDVTVANPAGLAALAGLPPPPVRAVSFAARLTDPAGVPTISNARLQIGPSDLDAYVAGLQLDSARVVATTPDAPMQLDLRGTLDSTPLQASGTLGTLASLFQRGAIPIDLAVGLGESHIQAKGSLGTPATTAGLDLDVSGRVRNLSAFDAFLPRPLPPLTDLVFSAHVLAAPGGLGHGFTLPELSLRLPQGDLSGAVDVRLRERPYARVRLRGSQFDLDGVMARLDGYHLLPMGDVPPSAALPFARTLAPVISDDTLDLSLLDKADADVALDIGTLTFTGLQFKDMSATLALKDGRLLAEPVHAQLPGGGVQLRASLDTRAANQPVALRLHAPGLAVLPLLRLLGRTEDITGTMEVDADLAASGHSLHAMAGSVTGHVGLALVDGTVDNLVLVPLLSGVLRVARLPPDLLFGPGRSRLRCAALRIDSTAGQARLASFLVDADRALIQADGDLQLGAEIMNLRLRPTLRVGGPGVVVPLTLRGSFRAPVLALDKEAVSGDVATALASLAAGRAQRGPDVAPNADQCAAALAVVRGGAAAGAVPAAPPSPAVVPRYRFVPSK